MAKRYVMVCGVLIGTLSLALISGCRAYNSSYASPEADLAAQPKKPADPAANKPATPPAANPSGNAPIVVVDYSKDTTECKTPEGVRVGKNPSALVSNSGWVLPIDGEQVTVTATKKGPNSATITIQKDLPNKSSVALSFVVKQTADDKFSACNFSYTEGAGRDYPGVTGNLMFDRVNAVDEKAGTIVNSGSFALTVTRTPSAPTATKVQTIYLGATIPATASVSGTSLDGTYFIDTLVDSVSK